MTQDGGSGLLRSWRGDRRPSYMEVFFDLAFIFAMTRLTNRLVQDITMVSSVQTLVLLVAVWWIWTVMALKSNWFNAGQRWMQRLLAAMMLGGLVMSAAIPRAFEDAAAVFAGTYAATHLCRGLVVLIKLRHHPLGGRSLRVEIWFAATSVLWIIGILLPAARLWLWAGALAVDCVAGFFTWPVPRLGPVPGDEIDVKGEHLSVRLEQLFLIALGELILVSGRLYSENGFGALHTLGFVLAFLNATLFAQIYHAPTGRRLGAYLEEFDRTGRRSVIAAYLHVVLLAGILATAASREESIAHPHERPQVSVAIAITAGAVLFLAGRVLLSLLTNFHVSWARVVGVVVLVSLTPVFWHLPSVAASGIADGVLLAVAVVDRAVARARDVDVGSTLI